MQSTCMSKQISNVSNESTVLWWHKPAFFLFLFGGFGITGGAHRLWAHRSYKAKWPLRLLAAIAQTIAVQVIDLNNYVYIRVQSAIGCRCSVVQFELTSDLPFI